MSRSTREFLAKLWEGSEYGYLWRVSADGKRKLTEWVPASKVGEMAHPGYEEHIYYGVNPVAEIPSGHKSRKGGVLPPEYCRPYNTEIAAISTLYAEWDASPTMSKEQILEYLMEMYTLSGETIPPPSVIIDSGGGYHAFWLLDEPTLIQSEETRHMIQRVQAFWVVMVAADESAKDLTRILRLPGTRNVKEKYAPDYPEVAFVTCELDRTYTLQELIEVMWPDGTVPPVTPKGGGEHYDIGDYAPGEYEPYVQAALKGVGLDVSQGLKGGRTGRFFAGAARMGELVHAGFLEERDAEVSLMQAAADCGLIRDYGEYEMLRQFKNGLDAGAASSNPSLPTPNVKLQREKEEKAESTVTSLATALRANLPESGLGTDKPWRSEARAVVPPAPSTPLAEGDQEELARLRRENHQLKRAVTTIRNTLSKQRGKEGYGDGEKITYIGLVVAQLDHALGGGDGPARIQGGKKRFADMTGRSASATGNSLNKIEAACMTSGRAWIEHEMTRVGYTENGEVRDGEAVQWWETNSELVITAPPPSMPPRLGATERDKKQRGAAAVRRAKAEADKQRVEQLENAICPHCEELGLVGLCHSCGSTVEPKDYDPIINGTKPDPGIVSHNSRKESGFTERGPQNGRLLPLESRIVTHNSRNAPPGA